jgi:hypothetical protein
LAIIRSRTELDTLSQLISANLTRAALEAAPVIADLSSWLADVAGKAGIAWERLFDAPEEKSLRTLRYELDLAVRDAQLSQLRVKEIEAAEKVRAANENCWPSLRVIRQIAASRVVAASRCARMAGLRVLGMEVAKPEGERGGAT